VIVQVEKQFEDFVELQVVLSTHYIDAGSPWNSPVPLVAVADSLRAFLQTTMLFLGEDIWNIEEMMTFLDNMPQRSQMTNLRIFKLTQQVGNEL
jgi:hypothetical protein